MGDWESYMTSTLPGRTRSKSVIVDVDIDLIEKLSHTQGFNVDEFVVTRRGTTGLPITLRSQSKLNVESVSLVYEEGKAVELEVTNSISTAHGKVITVTIPPTAPVTLYTLTVKGLYSNNEEFCVTLKKQLVVLFNAWCKDDSCYLEDQEEREEYVLNSSGRVYAGDKYGMAWSLALYRPDSLRATLFLLESVAKLTFEEKANPVLMARELSAVVNVQDDNGLLVGRWNGEYEDGTPPDFWRGSGKILEQYYRSNGEPVKYGQCWVFSGVLLSVMRILGLPSRSVTNFDSAHDTNRNRTIDEYYDENGDSVDYLSSGSDSIWNFHVWNEAWMSRPDLPPGFGGWQVLDATPQEESPQGGGYRTGPAPLKAIKEGTSVPFDTNFVIAEVNADIKLYTIESDGAPRLFDVDQRTVGRAISTKQVGSWRRNDITHLYKYPEGSKNEREALYHGLEELEKESHDIKFEIPELHSAFGQDVVFEVRASNKGHQHRVQGKIRCHAVDYTGKILGKDVMVQEVDEKVNKGKTETITATVDGTVFTDYTNTKVFLKFIVYLSVTGTSQIFSKTVPYSPVLPELKITASDKVVMGKEEMAVVTFTNPLPYNMTDTTLTIECDELLTEDVIAKIGTLESGATFKYDCKFIGERVGPFSLVVGLDSAQTKMISGEKQVDVAKHGTPQTQPSVPVQTLNITDIDLHKSTNSIADRTSRYAYPNLIARRGSSVTITATSAKKLAKDVKIITRAVFQSVGDWRRSFEVIALSTVNGLKIKVTLQIPADVPVGEYDVLLTLTKGGVVTVVPDKIRVVILFNPWCKEDSCHYPEEGELDEYVLNNTGMIWVGSSRSNYGRPWQFAQFTKDSLEVSLWLLNKLSYKSRADPVQVVRHMSALLNSQDDDGVLVGNWSGDYEGGASPTSWTGSAEILAEFNKTKNPVKYGQCWVFSGIQTTVLRALGLPARSVTNFDSAHDTNFNRAVDKFYDEDGEPLSNDDSIWNFHVWNEAWMSRPDLPPGFGGWQVLDATPQEESPQGGLFRLGPCSRVAVKRGQRMNYDVEFVISEVNADVRFYTVHEDGTKTLSGVNRSHVGKQISTKAVGRSVRQDLTLDYKFKERSTEERAAVLNGPESESEKAIGVEVDIDEDVVIGSDFNVRVTVTNKTSHTKTLTVKILGKAVLYTGAPSQTVKTHFTVLVLKGKESKTVGMIVDDTDYLRILQGGNFINFVAMVINKADKQSVVKTENFRLKTPDIEITLPEGGLKVFQPATIDVSFNNPLAKRLEKGRFSLSGEGHIPDSTVDIQNVSAYGTVSARLEVIPVRAGPVLLVAKFFSTQLVDVFGHADTKVEAN